jgi:hypothetical protein
MPQKHQVRWDSTCLSMSLAFLTPRPCFLDSFGKGSRTESMHAVYKSFWFWCLVGWKTFRGNLVPPPSTTAFYPEDGTGLYETLIFTEQAIWRQVTEDPLIILHFTLILPKLTHAYSRPMDSIQPKYQTANSLRSAIRSRRDSGILQRIAETCIKNVVSCSQWRDLDNRRQVKTIRWQCKLFDSVSQHICMLTWSRHVGPHAGVAVPPVLLPLHQDLLTVVRLCDIRLFRWFYGRLRWTHTVGNCLSFSSWMGEFTSWHPYWARPYGWPCLSVCPRVNNPKTVQRISNKIGTGKFCNNL